MVISISSQQFLSYFMPILTFLLVFVIIYALLTKSKILGGSNFIQLLISFIAAIFVISSPFLGEFTRLTATWIAVFVITITFILAALSFTGKNITDISKTPFVGYIVIFIVIIIFIFSTIQVFGPVIKPYLPGQSDTGGAPELLGIKHFLFHPAIIGSVILFIAAAVVSSVLTKGK